MRLSIHTKGWFDVATFMILPGPGMLYAVCSNCNKKEVYKVSQENFFFK